MEELSDRSNSGARCFKRTLFCKPYSIWNKRPGHDWTHQLKFGSLGQQVTPNTLCCMTASCGSSLRPSFRAVVTRPGEAMSPSPPGPQHCFSVLAWLHVVVGQSLTARALLLTASVVPAATPSPALAPVQASSRSGTICPLVHCRTLASALCCPPTGLPTFVSLVAADSGVPQAPPDSPPQGFFCIQNRLDCAASQAQDQEL